MKLVESNPANFSVGRFGKLIIRGYFHRTAIRGDTAIGEGNYFHAHPVQASAHYFIDLLGAVVQSVRDANTAYAVNQWVENEISISIEFAGPEGTPLTSAQIVSARNLIKTDPALKVLPLHRLTLAEILGEKVAGFGCHKDVTLAYKIAGGHTDNITESEIVEIFEGAK